MIVFPNAKINIGLDILRRRSDGYHDISTVMYPIGWRDILEIVPSESGMTTLTVTGNHVDCPPEKNLVMKAVRLLEDLTEIPASDIYLHKVIPDGAGMGGGSADAAFTLMALNEMYGLGISLEDLVDLASKLGADCPFFIYNKPMLAEGVGEKLSKADIDLSGCGVLVIKPDFSISTGEAYGGVVPKEASRHLSDRLSDDIGGWRTSVKNAFVEHLAKKYPVINEITVFLYENGAVYASMTGSGSAVYGIFESSDMADAVKREWEEIYKGWHFYAGKL